MTPPRRFIDTNVLVYLFSADARRADAAEAIVAGGGVISVQVLNEFAAVARRKLGHSWTDVRSALAAFKANLHVVPLGVATHEAAVEIAAEHGLSMYDALIVASALEAGCDLLISEDLQHGRAFDGLRILDPFRV